uniref:Uncharacterized protein n=1 Tax=Avena sativa TaxID=4498 RepID=A0ACD5Y350_AVESA
MDRVKRAVGMARGASAVPARKGEDESLVLFGELYRHDQEKEVNLLEPMFSVEFESIQGDRRMYKLASGKRDYLLTDGEKHDYDWLKTPPATPLFASLEMEADSCQMVFQRELPILQPVKISRFSGKPEAPSSSTSTKSESPTTSSSSRAATPTTRPNSSSKKNLTTRAAPAFSKEEAPAYKMDKRSSYTPLGNRQHNAVVAPTTDTKVAKKTSSGKKPTVPGSTNAAKSIVDKPLLKKTAAAAPRARTKGPLVGAKDPKVDAGNGGVTRRVPSQPAAAMGTAKDPSAPVAARGRSRGGGEPATGNSARVAEAAVVTGKDPLAPVAARGRSRGGAEPATGNGVRVAEAAVAGKGRRRVGGEKEQQRQEKLGSHAKKLVA